MRIVMFYHSLLSDWNHGNAHFLRGIATELLDRGHDVRIYEPRDAWSVQNLVAERGLPQLYHFRTAYPTLKSRRYDRKVLDLDSVLDRADLVIVHEWNDHRLVKRIGLHRRRHRHYRLLFHDTHHRSVTDRKSMSAYDLDDYDGVLAFGRIIRQIYLTCGWARRAWTWHEAADTRVFHPRPDVRPDGDLVWIGNWGDDERTAELHEFLLGPVRALKLKALVHGVCYPLEALKALARARIRFGGWLPNYQVPEVFARHKVTIHVPRRPYVRALPGIPTIRPFEALACGIPLISAPWDDAEHLFTPGEDFLVARTGRQMREHLKAVLQDRALARALSTAGRRCILARHTCAHRVDELLDICGTLGLNVHAGSPLAPASGGSQ